MQHEKGFVYPITLCLMILISTLLILHMEYYLTEKRMLQETENILKQDTYLLLTVKKFESAMSAEEPLENEGSMTVGEGRVDYSIREQSDSIREISMTLTMEDRSEFRCFVYYDVSLQKMVKWIEVT